MKKTIYEIPDVEIEYIVTDEVVTSSVEGPKDRVDEPTEESS